MKVLAYRKHSHIFTIMTFDETGRIKLSGLLEAYENYKYQKSDNLGIYV